MKKHILLLALSLLLFACGPAHYGKIEGNKLTNTSKDKVIQFTVKYTISCKGKESITIELIRLAPGEISNIPKEGDIITRDNEYPCRYVKVEIVGGIVLKE